MAVSIRWIIGKPSFFSHLQEIGEKSYQKTEQNEEEEQAAQEMTP